MWTHTLFPPSPSLRVPVRRVSRLGVTSVAIEIQAWSRITFVKGACTHALTGESHLTRGLHSCEIELHHSPNDKPRAGAS